MMQQNFEKTIGTYTQCSRAAYINLFQKSRLIKTTAGDFIQVFEQTFPGVDIF